jgi:hypothetical protein
MNIRAASNDDLKVIAALLREAHLPSGDITSHIDHTSLSLSRTEWLSARSEWRSMEAWVSFVRLRWNPRFKGGGSEKCFVKV